MPSAWDPALAKGCAALTATTTLGCGAYMAYRLWSDYDEIKENAEVPTVITWNSNAMWTVKYKPLLYIYPVTFIIQGINQCLEYKDFKEEQVDTNSIVNSVIQSAWLSGIAFCYTSAFNDILAVLKNGGGKTQQDSSGESASDLQHVDAQECTGSGYRWTGQGGNGIITNSYASYLFKYTPNVCAVTVFAAGLLNPNYSSMERVIASGCILAYSVYSINFHLYNLILSNGMSYLVSILAPKPGGTEPKANQSG